MKLCIAEKPSVAKDISRVIGANVKSDGYYYGNGYIVTWAIGHLVGLAEPEAYGFVNQSQMYASDEAKQRAYDELPLIPKEFKLVVLETTKKQFYIIKSLMEREDVTEIIDCGDMGAEGHILQWLIRTKAECKKTVKRFCATSMTDEAIKNAMGNLRDINDFIPIIRGELCKKKEDWILGMSLSRALSIKYNAGINVGRVQSPTLAFVVKRYLDVINFRETKYYTLRADIKSETPFSVFWEKDTKNIFPFTAKKDDKIIQKDVLEQKLQAIKSNGIGTVVQADKQKRATNRPQLYDITELQREANEKYGYSASVTLATAQALYETQKVLSYPRTDSRYITSDLMPYISDRLKRMSEIGKYKLHAEALLNEGLNIDKKIVDDSKVTDHHAIIPTENIDKLNYDELIPTLEEKKKGVTKETLINILDLVLTRFIVSFCHPYIYEQTKIVIDISGLEFTASGTRPIDEGWKRTQEALLGKSKEEKTDEQKFPELTVRQTVNLSDCAIVEKKTTPPKLHTESTLLTAMENAGATIENGAILKGKGIGTQATRAEIIKKLFDTGVVEHEYKGKTPYIKPTRKGLSVIEVLPEDLYSPKLTADWETKISKIVDGTLSEKELMAEFEEFIKNKVLEVKKRTGAEDVSFNKPKENYGNCPWCNSNVLRYKTADNIRYYCDKSCGWQMSVSDKAFTSRLGRNITEKEAERFIKQKKITLTCEKQDKSGTYKGEFSFTHKLYNGKKYCNIKFDFKNSK